MALPELPTQGQSPWFTPRNNWDLAVKSELEGRLSETELNATIGASTAGVFQLASTLAKPRIYRTEKTGAPSVSVVELSVSTNSTEPSLIRPFEPQGRRIVLQNIGNNPVRLIYTNAFLENFDKPPASAIEASLTIVNPRQEFVGVSNAPLWAYSELGTEIVFRTEIGADL